MKYILQPYTTPASRSRCPQCNHRSKTFKRYINTETNMPVATHVGRCDRENKCGYHYKPGQYFQEPGVSAKPVSRSRWQVAKPRGRIMPTRKNHRPLAIDHGLKDFLCINPDIVNASFKQYEHNNLVQYLIRRFGFDIADQLVGRYRIGTSKHWPGAAVFWQLDALGNVRTGKVMLYNAETGKRIKKPFNHVTWAHVLLSPKWKAEKLESGTDLGLQTQDFILKQCLFGEHLLAEFPQKPVAIVESEKTAVIASALNSSFIWMAAGSVNNLNPQICQVLKGRHVTLYPDLGAYDKWMVKARLLQVKILRTTFNVSDILERSATDADRKQGLDIADFL